MPKSRAGYLPTLDGWRAIAALTVLGAHLFSGAPGCPRVYKSLIDLVGWNAVSLFFGISGLLITSRLLEERAAFGQISLWRFYVRRVCRILPAAWMYLIVVAFFQPALGVSVDPQGWAGAFFFYRNYNTHQDVTSHFWSLAIEEQFYLTWPWLLVFLGKRRAALTAAGLCCLIFLWRWVVIADVARIVRSLPPNPCYRTDTRLDALLVPSILAVLLDNPEFKAALRAWFSTPIWLALAIGFVVAGFAPAYSPFASSCAFTAQAVCCALLVTGTVLHSERRLERALESPPMRWLGRISYSLYLWQQPFTGNWQTPIWQRCAASIGAAAASFYAVERPFMRLGHRLAPSATPGRLDLEPSTDELTLTTPAGVIR